MVVCDFPGCGKEFTTSAQLRGHKLNHLREQKKEGIELPRKPVFMPANQPLVVDKTVQNAPERSVQQAPVEKMPELGGVRERFVAPVGKKNLFSGSGLAFIAFAVVVVIAALIVTWASATNDASDWKSKYALAASDANLSSAQAAALQSSWSEAQAKVTALSAEKASLSSSLTALTAEKQSWVDKAFAEANASSALRQELAAVSVNFSNQLVIKDLQSQLVFKDLENDFLNANRTLADLNASQAALNASLSNYSALNSSFFGLAVWSASRACCTNLTVGTQVVAQAGGSGVSCGVPGGNVVLAC